MQTGHCGCRVGGLVMGCSGIRLTLTTLVGFVGWRARWHLGGRHVNGHLMWSVGELGRGGESQRPHT